LTETIIIFRIGSLGDTVVALPCFHQIARSFPDSRRILVTDVPVSQRATSVESVLGRGGLIHDVIYFPPPPRKLRDIRRFRSSIAKTKAKILVYVADRRLMQSLRDILFLRACGVRRVIGAPLSRDLRKPRVDPTTGFTEREAERLVRCLAPLGPIDLDDPSLWELYLQPDERRAATAALAPLGGRDFIAVSIGGKDRRKDWGDPNWTELLRLMALEWSDVALVFIGTASEFDRSAGLAKAWPGQIVNLCGGLTPRESAAVMQQALLYLGHDNGPMHLAAAVGTPCVAMFGSFNMPRWWHPMGKGHRIIHDLRGIRAISVEEVQAAVRLTMSEVLASASRRNVEVPA
jgi:ADP-heptose:LPS heptosyltransferase